MLLGAHPDHLVQKGLMIRIAEWERGKREPEERESELERGGKGGRRDQYYIPCKELNEGEKERKRKRFGRGRATWAW